METSSSTATTKLIVYDDKVTRQFVFWSITWGLVGMLVGLLCALQMAFPALNFSEVGPWFTFSRIRPLHTNAVIFALVGNMMFAGIYYSTQRLLKVRMANDLLSWAHFWLSQVVIVSAATKLAAQADLTATVARTFERSLVRLKEAVPAFEADHILPFANRLSDYFWILARYLDEGTHQTVDYSLLDE